MKITKIDPLQSQPVEDGWRPLFCRIYTDEGIYTIKAYNRFDKTLESTEKKIYVGTNNILTAYTLHLNDPKPYSIEQLNNMVSEGWTVMDNGNLIPPESDETAVPVIATTVETSTEAVTETDTTSIQTTLAVETVEKKNSPILPIICGIAALAGIGAGAGFYVFKNKKK